MAHDKTSKRSALRAQSQPEPPAPDMVMLAVGEFRQWQEAGHPLPADGDLYFADITDINTAFLVRIRPDVVLAPLMSSKFDCVDLAAALVRAGFTGRLRALAPFVLPNPNIIRREVKSFFPDLDFDVIIARPGGLRRPK